MFTEEELQTIIKLTIEKDEKLGDQSSGSDHLCYISYSLNGLKTKRLTDTKTEVRYYYTIFVETEFTIYPDNPPVEYPKTRVIVVDKDKNVIKQD